MKRFILRDSRIKGVACTAINAVPIGEGEDLYEVRLLKFKRDRSLAQNALMWLWLTHIANFINDEHGMFFVEELGWVRLTPEWLKNEIQERYLGYSPYVRSSGHIGQRLKGTSELNTAEFTELLTRIEVWARSELGCDLPHPADKYCEAMGINKEAE